ncbi:Mycoplasma protein of unknown function, DUF285 [Seminavis robusta]|uniref:BspA family leucine-rich repeat surface protein n=1 Tax=Seminavis robusta TaxID=568900 RepID=A0A9N8DJ06_9STRA|nr:Mycoplasma protein of unknown function, DUF285 [Seminavis robusta]|eukprot:Sro86_g045890.1 Mycoplasma protein of unknown function, DUF285 (705) ;mRNA; f:118446-123088
MAVFGDKSTLITALEQGDYSATGPYGSIESWNVQAVENFDAAAFNVPLNNWVVSSVTDMSYLFGNSGDVSSVTSLEYTFRNAAAFNSDISSWGTAFNGNLNSWDISSVSNLQGAFKEATSFNGDIRSWDTRSVTSMYQTFMLANSFNGDLSSWGATIFNGDISTWDTGNVLYMNSVFLGATAFNVDISSWDVAASVEFNQLFDGASALNHDLCTWGTKITGTPDVTSMFQNTSCPEAATVVDLGASPKGPFCHVCSSPTKAPTKAPSMAPTKAPTKAPTTAPTEVPTKMPSSVPSAAPTPVFGDKTALIAALEQGDYSPTGPYGSILTWNVQAVDNFDSLISGLTNVATFNGDVSMWDVSGVTSMIGFPNVTDMMDLFKSSGFNSDLSNWVTSSVTSLESTFSSAAAFNGDISSWDTSKVTTIAATFSGATSFNGDISTWQTQSVNEMYRVFYGATKFDGNLSGWQTGSLTALFQAFMGATMFSGTGIGNWDVSKDVSKVTHMFSTFKNSAFNRDVSSWDISSVTEIYEFLQGAPFNHEICAWGNKIQGTATVTSMFVSTNCPSKDHPDLGASPKGPFCHSCSPTNMPSYVPSAAPTPVFGDKTALIAALEQGDYSPTGPYGSILTWNVQAVDNFDSLISGLTNVATFNGDVSMWDVSGVTSMNSVFLNAAAFNVPLNNWVVSSVTDMMDLFKSSGFNSDLSNW